MKDKLLTTLALALVIALFTQTPTASAFPGGQAGATRKPGSTYGGCTCHSASPTTSVVVAITGPASLTPGQKSQYQVTVAGASGTKGGVNIAVSSGLLEPVSTFLSTNAGELVHNQRVTVPSTYTFNYTAPASPGTVTMYATGKDNVMAQWNWAPDYSVTVSGGSAPTAPVLTAPANNATNQPASVTFTWGASSGATNYRLQVSADSLFGATIYNDSTLGTTSKAVGALQSQKKYFWRVSAKNASGWSQYSSVWKFTTGTFTGVTTSSVPPIAFALHQNYPNPFNPSTTIRYELPTASLVNLKVFDLVGHEVVALVSGLKAPGEHTVRFDASGLASGVYIYRIEAKPLTDNAGPMVGSTVVTRKLVLLR